MELNPDKDLAINVADLTTEFREFPIVMYRYSQARADADTRRDLMKAKLKETKALVYRMIKTDTSVKHTAQSMEMEIDLHPSVIEANIKFVQAEHDASTWAGAVESMRSKKDVLIQLGSDRRKEI